MVRIQDDVHALKARSRSSRTIRETTRARSKYKEIEDKAALEAIKTDAIETHYYDLLKKFRNQEEEIESLKLKYAKMNRLYDAFAKKVFRMDELLKKH